MKTPLTAPSPPKRADMDAVRVMTIHGSKGLEFRAVHFPALATRYMPSNWHGIRCPPPPSLPHLAMQPAGHEAEEECLFFVALSRAQDYLSLSRAERYTAQKRQRFQISDSVASGVPAISLSGLGRLVRHRQSVDAARRIRDAYPERELISITQCPARYRYEVIEGLRGGRDESAYIRFHGCVYATIGWLEAATAKRNGRRCPRAHWRN